MFSLLYQRRLCSVKIRTVGGKYSREERYKLPWISILDQAVTEVFTEKIMLKKKHRGNEEDSMNC